MQEEERSEELTPIDESDESLSHDIDTQNEDKSDLEIILENAGQNESNPQLAGGINEEKHEKQPLFVLDEKKPDCSRDDHLYLISKKVGFYGLIIFLILSIVFGALNKVWENSLNMLFMGLAVLSYGIQDMLHLKAISKCKCRECTALSKKLKNIIILCVTVTIVLIILFGVRQFATF